MPSTINIKTLSQNAQFQQFVQFAETAIASGKQKAIARVDTSEVGGIAYKTSYSDHDWGYARRETSQEEFLIRLRSLLRYVVSYPSIHGFCYTQFTDVMQEVNGLASEDRTPKAPVEVIREIIQLQ